MAAISSSSLVPGIYRVDVEQSRSFKHATRERIEVTVAGAIRADISMSLATLTRL